MTATWASSVGSSSATSGWLRRHRRAGRCEDLGHESFGLRAHLGLVGNDDDAFGDRRVGQRNDEQNEPCRSHDAADDRKGAPPAAAQTRIRRQEFNALDDRHHRDRADRPQRHHDADGEQPRRQEQCNADRHHHPVEERQHRVADQPFCFAGVRDRAFDAVDFEQVLLDEIKEIGVGAGARDWELRSGRRKCNSRRSAAADCR